MGGRDGVAVVHSMLGNRVRVRKELLFTIEFVINNSPTTANGYTPFFLNYGFHPCTLVDLIQDHDPTMLEGVNQFVDRIKKNFLYGCQNSSHRTQRPHKDAQADEKRRKQRFNSGD